MNNIKIIFLAVLLSLLTPFIYSYRFWESTNSIYILSIFDNLLLFIFLFLSNAENSFIILIGYIPMIFQGELYKLFFIKFIILIIILKLFYKKIKYLFLILFILFQLFGLYYYNNTYSYSNLRYESYIIDIITGIKNNLGK